MDVGAARQRHYSRAVSGNIKRGKWRPYALKIGAEAKRLSRARRQEKSFEVIRTNRKAQIPIKAGSCSVTLVCSGLAFLPHQQWCRTCQCCKETPAWPLPRRLRSLDRQSCSACATFVSLVIRAARDAATCPAGHGRCGRLPPAPVRLRRIPPTTN